MFIESKKVLFILYCLWFELSLHNKLTTMTKVTDKIRDLIDPKHEGFRHTVWFKILLGLLLLILLGVVYSVFIRPNKQSRTSSDEREAEAAREAELDTLDVVGDYLWPDVKGSKDTEEEKKDDKEDETKPVEHAQAAPEAAAATDEDIEEATGQAPETGSNETGTASKDTKPTAPKVENMDKPTVEKID